MITFTCEGCHAVQAARHITDRKADGRYRESHYCESCYLALSEGRLTDLIPPPEGPHPFNRLGSLSDVLCSLITALAGNLPDKDVREIADMTVKEVERRGGIDKMAVAAAQGRQTT